MALLCFLLTFFGFVNTIVPQALARQLRSRAEVISITQRMVEFISNRIQLDTVPSVSPQSLLYKLSLRRRPPPRFLDFPPEVRTTIYEWACFPQVDGSCPGALHLILLCKQIHREAKQIFDQIPHKVVIADSPLPPMELAALWGMPRRVYADWHLQSIKSVVIVLSVIGIGKMSPDTFDAVISKNGKVQWRSLKQLIGIWPEAREAPLEQLRIDLQRSEQPNTYYATYRADLIRVIRNFKRTSVWAETGDCNGANMSVLLPLARAFNEARKYWVENADMDNNLFVEYDSQHLRDDVEADEASRATWKVEPSDDTSRTDDYEYPPLSEAEETYIESKMKRREESGLSGTICEKCLAYFDQKREYRFHLSRGHGW